MFRVNRMRVTVEPQLPVHRKAPLALPLTLALPVDGGSFPERFQWAAEQGFALTYAPSPEAFNLLPDHVGPFIQSGVPVRYHGFFPGYEIGDRDRSSAERALALHIRALESIQGYGEPVITFHIGLDPQFSIDPDRAVENLGRLVDRGKGLGITVSIENLRRGISSDPQTILRWAQATGAGITFDIGHAAGSEQVTGGKLSLSDVIGLFGACLVEVHFYEKEMDRHYPPQNMKMLGPMVDQLRGTACRWWTIELQDPSEALSTRALLLDYLSEGG